MRKEGGRERREVGRKGVTKEGGRERKEVGREGVRKEGKETGDSLCSCLL